MSKIKGKLRFMREKQAAFFCPGCQSLHLVNVDPARRPCWGYNGDPQAPTFTPSVLVKTGSAVDPTIVWEEGDPPIICHSFVRHGRIVFLNDSTHALAGQTVDLPEIESDTP